MNRPTTMQPLTMGMTLVVVSALGVAAQGGPIKGEFVFGGGYLDHPRGLEYEMEAAYLSQALRLTSDFNGERNIVRLGYEGYANQFGNDTSLGVMKHGLGAEWFRTTPGTRDRISAGIQGSYKIYQDWYTVYDHAETFAYLSFKKYAGTRTLWQGFAALRGRFYADLPEESFLEPHGRLEVKRFFDSRTTVGAAVRYGIKYFHDAVASQVWETPNLPSTSQLAARLTFSQGISDRLGFRAWGDYRWKLSEFPHYIEADIYDSPLLDRYAHEGIDGLAALKWLSPMQTWIEAAVFIADRDYGEILFPVTEGAVTAGKARSDQVQEYSLTATRRLGKGMGRPDLKLAGGWRNQDSNLANYTYDGVFYATTLSWRW